MTVSNTTQQEQLKEIGSYLKQIREEQSITLDEVAIKTRIRYGLLQAIEEGELEQLPEPVFIQGFIRRYGEVVGLDGCALAQTFTIAPIITSIPPNALEVASSNKFPEREVRKENLGTAKGRGIPVYVSLLMLVLAGLGGAVYLLNKQLNKSSAVDAVTPQQPAITQLNQKADKPTRTLPPPPATIPTAPANKTPNPPISSVSPSPIAKPENKPANSVTPSPITSGNNTTPNKSPINVSVDVKGDSWVRVVADGKTVFEGTLSKGKQQAWTANKKLTIRSGNAGAVYVAFNHKQATDLGKEGQVEEVTFTPEP
ncbi:MAG: RodZ domain-containing protein [Nostocaceae cyanobacterium]|nr:RodZ domain-containing protein [Nostocaceae cyanobacterium]